MLAAVRVLALIAALPALAAAPAALADTPSPAPCPAASAHPWCDRSLSPDARALLFQRAMTEAEEITLVGGNGTGAGPHTGATYAIPRLGLRACRRSWRRGTPGRRAARRSRAFCSAMPIPVAGCRSRSRTTRHSCRQQVG
jgi:hypothetical protein